MIDIRKLKELVKLMVENDLAELDLRDQEETVTIKRGSQGPVLTSGQLVPVEAAAAPADNGETSPAAAAAPAAGASDNGLTPVESPMVGTFYSAPSPEADNYVSVGTRVSAGDVVCLVEAMKVFNEIKAEASGVVERVCVQSGDAVEFGQPLFMLKPA
ncbi:MAG: acetyl-CoA carboxylase biotin carboxyl carrier protein [Planctomycetota bacterium]